MKRFRLLFQVWLLSFAVCASVVALSFAHIDVPIALHFSKVGGFLSGVQGWPEPSSGPPSSACYLPPICSAASFEGAGRVTYDVVPNPPNPNLPGTFFSISKATYTLVLEPSTASLLLIAFAGLAVMSRRRRSDVAF
jgi:hypothetical protein